MTGGLAEADTRVDGDTPAPDPHRLAGLDPALEVIEDIEWGVEVARRQLHGLGIALGMHEDDRRPAPFRHLEAFGIEVKRGDIVDDGGAGLQSRRHHAGLAGVDRNRRLAFGETMDHRHHAGEFDRLRDRRRVRAGGLAADIEDIRPCRRQGLAVGDGIAGVGEITTVGETVGGDVDDPHDQGLVQ